MQEQREPLLVQDRGPARHLILNRPERRNALSRELLLAIEAAQRDLNNESGVRVVVVEANGPVFSSGHDLREIRESSNNEDLFALCSRIMLGFRNLPQPVIAKVSGMATAAGCQLAASADLIVASVHASFATPGVKIGLFCSTPMVPLMRAVSPKVAMEMLLSGVPLSAQRAYEVGLVNRVVMDDELDEAVGSYVNQIAMASPSVVATGKRAFYATQSMSEPAAYDSATKIMGENARHPDAREGIAAFLDKRQPAWKS